MSIEAHYSQKKPKPRRGETNFGNLYYSLCLLQVTPRFFKTSMSSSRDLEGNDIKNSFRFHSQGFVLLAMGVRLVNR